PQADRVLSTLYINRLPDHPPPFRRALNGPAHGLTPGGFDFSATATNPSSQGAGRGSSPCWTHTAVRLRPRRPTSAGMAVIMAGKRIPALPPNLNRVPGISNEELLCRRLEPLMRELLSQPVCLLGENQRREAERHIPNLAREMCEGR